MNIFYTSIIYFSQSEDFASMQMRENKYACMYLFISYCNSKIFTLLLPREKLFKCFWIPNWRKCVDWQHQIEVKWRRCVFMKGMFGNWDLDSINKMGIMHWACNLFNFFSSNLYRRMVLHFYYFSSLYILLQLLRNQKEDNVNHEAN